MRVVSSEKEILSLPQFNRELLFPIATAITLGAGLFFYYRYATDNNITMLFMKRELEVEDVKELEEDNSDNEWEEEVKAQDEHKTK